jgi:hypothetical protein
VPNHTCMVAAVLEIWSLPHIDGSVPCTWLYLSQNVISSSQVPTTNRYVRLGICVVERLYEFYVELPFCSSVSAAGLL